MRRRLELLALGLAIAIAVGGVFGLIAERFARADAYPGGSSLGAGPDGTRALAAALASLPGVTVERVLRPGDERGCGAGCTLVYAGAGVWGAPHESILERLDARLRAGARVVIAFTPVTDRTGCGVCADARADDDDAPPETGPDAPSARERAAPGWWRELRFAVREEPAQARRAAGVSGATLPAELPWRSKLELESAPAGARVLYERDGRPVLVERSVGRGVLVLATDDSWLGNRALRDERATAVVVAALGEPKRVLFEETHLGVVAGGGVMVLARRYGLGGAFVGLAVLAVLFVWRAQSPLAPRVDAPPVDDEDGRDAASGLVALLERGLPRASVTEACLKAYRQSGASRMPEETWSELEAIARTAADPAAGYEAVRAAIGARRA